MSGALLETVEDFSEVVRTELANVRVVNPDRLPTPFLAIDATKMFANLKRMADFARRHRLQLRPHIKTHKSAFLARQQLALGAVGLTSAKPSEAERVAVSADDLLLAYPCFTTQRIASVMNLARDRTVRVAVDSREAVRLISAQVAARSSNRLGLLVEIDVGHHRTGVQTAGQLLDLAKCIVSAKGVDFSGILFFPGHLVPSACDMEQGQQRVRSLLRGFLEALERAGIDCRIVSGGSTPSAMLSHLIPELTEIRPGTYVFNDGNSVAWECASLDQCAATVEATVISTAVPGKAVIDAGSKMLSSDLCGATPGSGFGTLLDQQGAALVRLSEEHGEIDLGEADWSPKLGDRVRIVPNHICPAVNLQDTLFLRLGEQEVYALSVDGRGCVR